MTARENMHVISDTNEEFVEIESGGLREPFAEADCWIAQSKKSRNVPSQVDEEDVGCRD